VVVSGTCAPNDTSVNAILTVNNPPVITAEPINQTSCVLGNATFSVTATGTGLTYQWRKAGVDISGATSATYTLTGVTALSAGTYSVVVSGTCAPNDTSVNATLTVNNPPIITAEPTSQTACVGGNATFSVTATGTGLSYQWRKAGVNISGATSATYTLTGVTASDAGSYSVVVSGTCIPIDSSVNAILTVNTPPTITSQPQALSLCPGATVSFSVTASGSTPTYQWRRNGQFIAAANSATYSFNNVSANQSGNFDVIITNACGTDTSNVAVLTVPNLAFTAGSNSPIQQGDTLKFSADTVAGALYRWTGPNGYTSNTQNPILTNAQVSASGAYSVYVIVGNCTSAVVNVNVLVSPVQGIDLGKTPLELSAYPNPTKQKLTVRYSIPQYGNASFSLLDLHGRSVLAQTLGNYPAGTHTHELDLMHLPAGLYLLKLDAAGVSQTLRVVKE
jgi:hypothetical protein